MVTKATKTADKKQPKKAVSASKKKASAVTRKPSAARTKSQKVDYYPNRMTVAISALAGTILVLVAVIAVLGSRS